MTYVTYGRCKSGKRWFWVVGQHAYEARDGSAHGTPHKCDDPVCIFGGPHEYGWEDTEDAALKAMTDAVARLGGEVQPSHTKGHAPGNAGHAASALKRINAARRRARPPKPGATGTTLLEYLYEPWSWSDYDNPPYETHKGINEIPIVKKTAKRIYYDSSDSWDRSEGVITLGYINREDFEADTRCKDTCPVDVAVTRCSEHKLSYPHCVHVNSFYGRLKARYEAHRENCAHQCPADMAEVVCAEHGYTWEHCPHRGHVGDCRHGSAAGVGDLPGRHYNGGTVYATREGAEDALYAREREEEREQQERERERQDPEIKRLRMAMANVHPDRGGTDEEFIAARERYGQALRKAS